MCAGLLFASVYAYVHGAQAKEARQSVRSPKTEVNRWLWATIMSLELKPIFLEEQPVVLTTEPSLQPHS